MKRKAMATLVLLALIAGTATAELIEYFDMNDAKGTVMKDLLNTGTLGSQWNFGGSSMETDGNGNFVLAGDGGTTTRKLPKKGTENAKIDEDAYAIPLTGNDTYRLELTFSAWDLTSATTGDSVLFKVNDSANVMVALLVLEKDTESSARLRFASANTKYRNVPVELTGFDTKIAVDFNLANGTSEYFLNDVSQYTFSDLTYAGDIGSLVFVKNGSWSTPDSQVSIDSMGLSVIPEPATSGLLVFSAAVILFIRRRFRL